MQVVMRQAREATDYDIRPQGHLVLMTCGHRGRPNRQEEKRISRLLRKSGFIPMLEELYGIVPSAEAVEPPAKLPKIQLEKSTSESMNVEKMESGVSPVLTR